MAASCSTLFNPNPPYLGQAHFNNTRSFCQILGLETCTIMHHLAATRTYRSEAGDKNTWETRVLDGRWSQISWSFSLLDNFHHPRRASSNHQDFQWLTGGPLASVGCNLVFKTRIAATLEIDTKEGADIKTWTADRLLADCWEEDGQQKLSHFFCIKWTSQNSIWCGWTLRAFQSSIIN